MPPALETLTGLGSDCQKQRLRRSFGGSELTVPLATVCPLCRGPTFTHSTKSWGLKQAEHPGSTQHL